MIKVDGLSKYYSGYPAIDDVSFSISEGEIIGVLGLNGAGKSTILKMLGTFLMPSSGSASIAGYSVTEEPNEIRKIIGYLPDTPPLYNEMPVKSYLRFVGKLKGLNGPEIEPAIKRVMDMTDIHDVAEVTLGSLSHGYRQRVAISHALVHDPKVLILDEPINGLDPVQIVEMRDLIVSLKGKHTVILSSHILSEITKTCDRILIIDQGRLVAEGSEADLEKQMSHQMRLICEVDNNGEQLASAFKDFDNVEKVSLETLDRGGSRLVLETNADIRKEVSSKVVQSGAGLLSFTSENAGLEDLFMKLVKTSTREN